MTISMFHLTESLAIKKQSAGEYFLTSAKVRGSHGAQTRSWQPIWRIHADLLLWGNPPMLRHHDVIEHLRGRGERNGNWDEAQNAKEMGGRDWRERERDRERREKDHANWGLASGSLVHTGCIIIIIIIIITTIIIIIIIIIVVVIIVIIIMRMRRKTEEEEKEGKEEEKEEEHAEDYDAYKTTPHKWKPWNKMKQETHRHTASNSDILAAHLPGVLCSQKRSYKELR